MHRADTCSVLHFYCSCCNKEIARHARLQQRKFRSLFISSKADLDSTQSLMILTQTRDEADTVNFIYYNGLYSSTIMEHIWLTFVKVLWNYVSKFSATNLQAQFLFAILMTMCPVFFSLFNVNYLLFFFVSAQKTWDLRMSFGLLLWFSFYFYFKC